MTLLSGLCSSVHDGLGSGVNYNDCFVGSKLTPLTSAAALCSVMGLSPSTNPPVSLYTCREAALPVVDHISTPADDIDSAIALGPETFQVPGAAPLALELGFRTVEALQGANCSGTTENNVAVQSVTVLGLVYIETVPASANEILVKKGNAGASSPGYSSLGAVSKLRAEIADGTTQHTLTTATNIPSGWITWMHVVDRNTLTTTLHSSFSAAVSTTLTALASYSNAVNFRVGTFTLTPAIGAVHYFYAVWIGSGAEGITATNFTNWRNYIGI